MSEGLPMRREPMTQRGPVYDEKSGFNIVGVNFVDTPSRWGQDDT